MKKALSVLLVAVMILCLAGCASEGQQLYEKYASIIDMLEAKDFQGAIREITALAVQEQQGNVEKVPALQVLADSWYTGDSRATESITFNADGTCVMGGKTMTWVADGDESATYINAQILEDGVVRYFVDLNNEPGNAFPRLEVFYAEENEEGTYPGNHVATYVNHSMLVYWLSDWRAISEHERVMDNFYAGSDDVNTSDSTYKWTIVNGENEDSLTIHLDPRENAQGQYTVELSMRDGYPVAHITDDATGKTGLYIVSYYGYDKTWPEYIYVAAKENLEEYLENGSFWCELSGSNYSDSNDDALSYLYDQFVALGDYADAADILANWDAVKYSRAMRYLTNFEKRNSFWIGENQYGWNLDTLAFIKSQFEEIASYSEAAAVLENWDAVLYNRAMYYMDRYMNHDSFYIEDSYINWYSMTTVEHLQSLFEEISEYPEAAAVLENWDAVLYERAMYYLNCYINKEHIYIDDRSFYSHSDNYDGALAYIYPMFVEIADYSDVADILDRFTIVEDVLLTYNYTSVDYMNNEYTSGVNTLYQYNELGQVIRYSDYTEIGRLYGRSNSNAFYSYDKNGRIDEIKLGYTNDVDAVVTPIYDDNGNITSLHVVHNGGEYDILYTYDDQNRLTEIRMPYSSSYEMDRYYYFYTFAYDDAGNLVKKVYGYVYNSGLEEENIYEYAYDTAGNVVKETHTYNSHDSWLGVTNRTRTSVAECICDDNGNVIQKNWTYGNTVYRDGTETRYDNATSTYYYNYGNVYFFDSTGMETAE